MSAASTAVGLAGPALVVVGGWRWRPRAVRALPGGTPRSRPGPGPTERLGRAVTPIGHALRHGLRRPADPVADRRLGFVVLAGAASLLVWPPLAVLLPLVGAVVPRSRARRAARRRADQIADGLPEVVDLLTLAAGAGLTALSAVGVAADRSDGPVGQSLAAALRSVTLGSHPDTAFAAVVDELGDPARPLVAALLSSTRDGTPLEPALERAGHEARLLRRRRAEEAARRVPVKLLFPLVLCTLPAFALLTVVPLLVAALGSLHA